MLLLEVVEARGVESSGRYRAGGLDAGMREKLDDAFEVFFGAFGRAGDGDYYRLAPDACCRPGHHGNCRASVYCPQDAGLESLHGVIASDAESIACLKQLN